MEYKLKVTDTLKWVNDIIEIKNTDDILILVVDFKPKYLSIIQSGSFSMEGDWFGVTFIKTDDTLYAKGEQIGEVLVNFPFAVNWWTNTEKYSATLIFSKVMGENLKEVYP